MRHRDRYPAPPLPLLTPHPSREPKKVLPSSGLQICQPVVFSGGCGGPPGNSVVLNPSFYTNVSKKAGVLRVFFFCLPNEARALKVVHWFGNRLRLNVSTSTKKYHRLTNLKARARQDFFGLPRGVRGEPPPPPPPRPKKSLAMETRSSEVCIEGQFCLIAFPPNRFTPIIQKLSFWVANPGKKLGNHFQCRKSW